MPNRGRAAAPASALARALGWLATTAALAGCGDSLDDPAKPTGVSAEASEDIATAVRVSWSTPGESRGYIEYGTSEELELTTPMEAEATEDHELFLLGLSPDTEYYYRVVTWDGADAGRSGIGTVHTGDLPKWLPSFEPEGDGHDQLTLLPISGETTAVIAIDPEGAVVWYHEDDRDFEISRALLSRDGKSIVYNAFSSDEDLSEDSELVRVSLDGSHTESIPVPLLAEDFVELEDGTLAALVVDKGDSGDPTQWGNQIVEVDAKGDISEVWSTSDCFDPDDQPGDDPSGWTLANALDYDDGAKPDEIEGDEAYYVGLSNLSSIVRVDRESGDCEWVLGGAAATIDFEADSTPFVHQDQFQVRTSSVFVFDTEGGGDGHARVVEYELDLMENLATEAGSYTADTDSAGSSPGEPTRVGGGTFISWGAVGLLERLDSDGETIWTLDTGGDVKFGYHTLTGSLYRED